MKLQRGQKVFFPFWGVGQVANVVLDSAYVFFSVPKIAFFIPTFALFPLPISCPCCGTRFFPFNPQKKYCSKECTSKDKYPCVALLTYEDEKYSDLHARFDLDMPISQFIKECEGIE